MTRPIRQLFNIPGVRASGIKGIKLKPRLQGSHGCAGCGKTISANKTLCAGCEPGSIAVAAECAEQVSA